MRDTDTPTKIQLIWASAAGPPYINTVPVPSQIGIKNGAASWTDGFPPLCFMPYAGGGAGPFGADFNGAFNQASAGIQWFQAGGPLFFDSGFSTSIGGYPKGAIIASDSTLGMFWQSTVDNNTADPDTGGANWNSISSGGNLVNVQTFTSSGTYTPTAGTNSIVVAAVGGGGGGSGCLATNSPANSFSCGTNGTSGAYGWGRYTAGFSPSVAVTIGAAGTGGVAGAGGNGGTTSFGALLSCPGGIGGSNIGGVVNIPLSGGQGNLTGLPTGANIFGANGNLGEQSCVSSLSFGWGGKGGESPFADGGRAVTTNANGSAGRLGSGGGGTASFNDASTLTGGIGGAGFVVVWEYG